MGFKTKHLQREEVKMADNVSFKVYLKDPSQGEETEVRRFVVDKEVSTSLVYIKEKLVSIFPVLADKIFSVSWTDEDGDSITIDTDEELILALTELPGPVYKLTATVRAAKKVEEPQEPGVGANMTHHGVTCDGCDKAPIVGFRYKCVVCDDYDLCAACEKAGKHPGPSSNRSPPRPSDPGGLAGDDEHGLLQRRRLAHQGARHPPAGQEVDSGTSLGSLSAALMWSCLLETNPYIFWSQLWDGTNPLLSLT